MAECEGLVVVVTASGWGNTLSTHHLGYPAAHALEVKDNRVLCGVRLAWFSIESADMTYVSCKRCLLRLKQTAGKGEAK